MEIISLKMEEELLNEIDGALKSHRYSTRTEFIRDAIRDKLTVLEKEDLIKKLVAFKGSLKSGRSDEEAGNAAMGSLAKKLNIVLD